MVGQRTQEIGVRRALGAKAADVVMMLLRDAMRPVAIGIVDRRRRRFRDDAAAGGDAVRGLGHRCDDLCGRVFVLAVAALLASIVPLAGRSASIRSRLCGQWTKMNP